MVLRNFDLPAAACVQLMLAAAFLPKTGAAKAVTHKGHMLKRGMPSQAAKTFPKNVPKDEFARHVDSN